MTRGNKYVYIILHDLLQEEKISIVSILRKPVEASLKKEILFIAFNRNNFCVLTQKIAFKRKQHCD